MDSTLARIPAQSHRQAMDWSLVLVSQGIETTIEQAEAEGRWALLVRPEDHQRAREAIQLYRLENRAWPWQQPVFHRHLLFDWGSLAWVILIGFFYWLDARMNLAAQGAMSAAAISHGEFWRLFTANWLHGDLGHLATNAVFGFVLLGLAMGRYGTGLGALAAYIAGAGGNLATGLLIAENVRSLGASAMVMGSLGLVAIQSIALWRQKRYALKLILSGIAGGAMLFTLLGLAPGTDVMAHLGGFLSGLLLGGVLSLAGISAENGKANLISGVVFAALVIVPWWLAILRG